MLRQKLILSYSSKILLQILQIAGTIIVARLAGPAVMGTVAFGMAYVSMFLFLTSFMGPAHVKLMSSGVEANRCVSTYAALKIVTGSLAVVGVLVYFIFQKYVLGISFESEAHQRVIFILLVSIALQQLIDIPHATFQARTEQAKQDIPGLIKAVAAQLMKLAAVFIGFGAVALASAELISTILIVPLVFFLFKGYAFSRPQRDLILQYLKISFPVIFIDIATTLSMTLDKVLLQYFWNSEQVGYYAVGLRIGTLLMLFGSSAGVLFFPLFSEAVERRDFRFIADKIMQYHRILFLFLMPAIICVTIMSGQLIGLILGKAYLPSAPVFSVMAAGTFLVILFTPYGNILTGSGKFAVAAIINIVSLIMFVPVFITLVSPTFSGLKAVGAAAALFSYNTLLGILYMIFARKYCVTLRFRPVLKMLIFGIVNFALFFYFYNAFQWVSETGLGALFPLIYFPVTYFALSFLGLMNREDWDTFCSIFALDKVYQYAKAELLGRSA